MYDQFAIIYILLLNIITLNKKKQKTKKLLHDESGIIIFEQYFNIMFGCIGKGKGRKISRETEKG